MDKTNEQETQEEFDAFEYDDEAIATLKSSNESEDEEDDQDEDLGHDESDEDEQEVTADEDQALQGGWRPKSEWDGDPEDWVSAKEFNARGQLMNRISEESKQRKKYEKELQQVKKALKVMGEHNKKMAEAERAKLIKELREERLNALDDDDHREAASIEDKIKDVEQMDIDAPDVDFEDDADTTENDQDESTNQDRQYTQEEITTLQGWINKNNWFLTNDAMRDVADGLSRRYVSGKNDDDFDVNEMLAYVEQGVKKTFPAKFARKKAGNAVTPDTGRGRSKKKRSSSSKFKPSDMSGAQASVARTFVKIGTYKNVQEYVDQLAELGELPAQQGE